MKVSTYLSPGCTALSHINGFHFPRVGNTSRTCPSRRSTPFPTNGRPSVNQPFFTDSPAGSHSAWSQAESLCKKFTTPAPHSVSSSAPPRASPKTDETAMHLSIPRE
ncbi:hypothetical protein AVEN_125944-1 [Araneus ventricosus]|uniref:Uncharacterized protein n=1 Tax=Araneus ventricosus TaxID=182803 RepID=A0A4Y2W8U1_ARAVE|nr:hypothetical protein AVEN_125944-1 [Araneus ventricosus]